MNTIKEHLSVKKALNFDMLAVDCLIFFNILYADIFDSPVKMDELYRFLPLIPINKEKIIERLKISAFLRKRISLHMNSVTLKGKEFLVSEKKRRLNISKEFWEKAQQYCNVLAHFPFIKMIAITGSLAMNNVTEVDDIDLLIVTTKNRLWTARLFTALFSLYLQKVHKQHLCYNFLLAENNLKFTKRNLYIAREFSQMIPLYGMDIYYSILEQNPWIKDFLPNSKLPPRIVTLSIKKTSFVRRFLEKMLLTPFGTLIERLAFYKTKLYYRKRKIKSKEVRLQENIFKGHEHDHNESIVSEMKKRLQQMLCTDELSAVEQEYLNDLFKVFWGGTTHRFDHK